MLLLGFSRFWGKCKKIKTSRRKNDAFTLAEVLITLGIIGVVAAMTLPTLISKFNSKAFETGLKKQLTVVQSTLEYLNVEKGLSQCSQRVINDPSRPGNQIYSAENVDCDAIRDELVASIKLKPIKNDFSSNYTPASTVIANGGLTSNDTVNYDTDLRAADAYYAPDGTIYFFNVKDAYVIIDVNGKKKPNKWGYDTFWLTFSQVGKGDKIRLTDEWATLVEKGGKLPRTIMTNGEDSAKDMDMSKSYGRW